MDLASEYRRQHAWRAWPAIYAALPGMAGASILDLGCGPGDQAADLAARGARVTGIDSNAQLIAHAQSRAIAGAQFRVGDLRDVNEPAGYDGIWCSFAAAYFPHLQPVLASWCKLVWPGGWVALVEVAGLFSHAPLPAGCQGFIERYVGDAMQAGRYDFNMGGKLAAYMRQAGLDVITEQVVPDGELSFTGPASADVLKAWTDRLDRMQLLARQAQAEYPAFRDEFLACLADVSHTSACRVHVCVARVIP